MDKASDDKLLSKKLFFIAIGVLVLSSIGVVFLLRHKKTATVSAPTGSYTLVPSDITTAAGVAQIFTATYPISGGWQNISDASIYIGGRSNDQWVHYNPSTKNFTLMGAAGSCTAGEATTLSTNYLSLNCGATSASGSGEKPMITFSLTPQPSSSGTKYMLNTIVMDISKKGSGGTGGNWTIK
jgi:hypothetical protein